MSNNNVSSYRGRGGGIYTSSSNGLSSSVALVNTTITGNTAVVYGGGIEGGNDALNVLNSTITNNTAGGGGGISGGGNLRNTIVAGNHRSSGLGSDLAGTFNGNNNNLIGTLDGATGTIGTGTDIVNPNVQLSPLQNNGGLTLTHIPLSGSPAINAGNNNQIPVDSEDLDNDGDTTEQLPFDARNLARISGVTVDIGAVEVQNSVILPSITLALSPVSVLENGTPNLIYTFTRTGATTNALTVNYGITGTATNGTDYATIANSVTFAANSATATVTVNPTADTTIEANETVALTLATGISYTISTTTAVTGTITNDDVATLPSITLAVAPVSVLEDGTPNLIYTFTRTGPITSTLNVNYGIAGTAVSTDYTGATPGTGKTITFAAGSATASLTINPTADTTIEANETVALTLATGTGYTVGTTTAVSGTIINDDPTITLGLNFSGISENSPSNFVYTFTRTGATTNALTANYSIAGNATATDYIGATPGTGKTITFAVGSATASLTLDPTADTTLETDETISLQLATGNGYTIGTTNPQIATIINDDGTRRQKGTNGKDVILGTNFGDILSGGLGNDVLTGGLGGDSFSFNALNEGIDTITDFSVGNDYLFVKGSGFGGGLVSGDINMITSAQFVIGTAATNTSQRFIYNSTNGALFFDVDGSGVTAASQFATLSPNLALNYQDIFVI